MNSKNRNSKVRELPNFTAEEKEKIDWVLCVMKFEEVWNSIAINKEWNLEIIRDSSYSFKSSKWIGEKTLDLLLKIWEVGLYSWSDENMWFVWFRLIPNDENIENPYTSVKSTLTEKTDKKTTEIVQRRKNIKQLVDSLLAEDKILEKRWEQVQDWHFSIPERVVNGETLEEILELLERM